MMSSISRWKRSGGGEEGTSGNRTEEEQPGCNYTAQSWRTAPVLLLGRLRLELQEIALDPTAEVVVFRFDLAPRPRGHCLIVSRQQNGGAFAQDTRARSLRAWLLADRHAESARIHDARHLLLWRGSGLGCGWLN